MKPELAQSPSIRQAVESQLPDTQIPTSQSASTAQREVRRATK